VSRLLDGLLRGAHPASALWSTREALRQVRHPEELGGHDWAAMAAWARWPAEGDQHLRPARLNQLRRSLHSQASRLDPFQGRSEGWDDAQLTEEWSRTEAAFEGLRKEVDQLAAEWPDQRSALLGSWAGNLRRAADRLLGELDDSSEEAQFALHTHHGRLRKAYAASLHAYRAIPRQRPGEEHFHTMQALLTARLGSAVGHHWSEEEQEQLVAEWIAAETALSVWARERSPRDPEVVRGLLLLLLSRPDLELELADAHLPTWARQPSKEHMPPWSSLPWVAERMGWDLRRLLWRAQRLSLVDWAGDWHQGLLLGGAPQHWPALVD
jgi:hypothetical protein